MDFEDEEGEQPFNNESIVGTGLVEETHKHPTQHHPKPKNPELNKHSNEQQINVSVGGQQQQQQPDEWEEFEDSKSKYEQLRLKFSRGNIDDDNEDHYYDDENNPNHNDDNNDLTGDHDQQKDKHVWKINQVAEQQTETTVPIVEEQQPPPPSSKPSTTSGGAYRAPAFRSGGGSSGAAVTIVSGGGQQRASKKKEPNLASNDEFPTLGSTVNKK